MHRQRHGATALPIAQEAEWVLGPVWTVVKNLAPSWIQFPDRPARNESLYQLRSPGP